MALCDRLEASLATVDTTRRRLLEALLHEALDPASGVLEGRNDEGAKRAMTRRFSLILFLVLVVGGGLVIGYLTAPGDWYAQLDKPAFNPPGWVFGPVWTVLYILIAIAGWRVWRGDRGGVPMKLWWTQLGLNFLWSPVFFSAHQIGLALALILLLLAAILAFIAATRRQDRVAAWLFVPYAAWVAFASVLNASIFALN
jgi:translocator protein